MNNDEDEEVDFGGSEPEVDDFPQSQPQERADQLDDRACERTVCIWPGHDLCIECYGCCRVCHLAGDSVLRGKQSECQTWPNVALDPVPPATEMVDLTAVAARGTTDTNDVIGRSNSDGGTFLFLPQIIEGNCVLRVFTWTSTL